MATMFFGQYLLEKGAIDREALLDALRRQREVNRTILELAVEEGALDGGRAEQVRLMYRTSSSSVEEMLVSSGFLTHQEVERLRAAQRAQWLPIGAALVQGGFLGEDELERQLAEYRRREEDVKRHLSEEIASLPDGRVVSAFFDLTAFHYGRLAGEPAKLASVERHDGLPRADARRFVQHFVGDRDLWFVIDLDPPVLELLARRLLPEPVAVSPEAVADAACEFVNVVGGNACTYLEPAECRLRPEPPFTSGIDRPFTPARQSVRGVVASTDSEFDVHLFIATADGPER